MEENTQPQAPEAPATEESKPELAPGQATASLNDPDTNRVGDILGI